MAKARITFRSITLDTQDYSCFDPNEDHMVSSIHFDLEIGGKGYPDMMAEVRQPFGTNYETEPLEVGRPIGSYPGNWNHDEFAKACEQYYRRHIGSTGSGFRITGRNCRMRNCGVFADAIAEFEIPEAGSEAW